MKFNKIDKIILFGGARLLAEFFQYILENAKLELVVFSSKRHLDENVISGKTLRELLEERNVKHYDCDDINTDENLKKEVNSRCLGIAIGAAWIFEKETVELFEKNHLLDFMGIDLPRYRGGAHYTWQILHQNRKGCANLQVIYGGADSFHKGDTLKREEYKIPDESIKPIDYFDFIVKKEINFLKDFLKEVEDGKDFSLKKLNEEESSYYPFLNTKMNGIIDWSWSGKDIYLFINAFDDPYVGASTFLNEKKVFLKNCRIIKSQEQYHPFTSGLIIRKDMNRIFVATKGGILSIGKVLDEEGNDIKNSINLGDRLYTPIKDIEDAKKFKANYNARGLEIKK